MANSHKPLASVEVSHIKSGVPSGARQFVARIFSDAVRAPAPGWRQLPFERTGMGPKSDIDSSQGSLQYAIGGERGQLEVAYSARSLPSSSSERALPHRARKLMQTCLMIDERMSRGCRNRCEARARGAALQSPDGGHAVGEVLWQLATEG